MSRKHATARVSAPRLAGAAATPFGPRLHAAAVYLKTFQALSYERLQRALCDLFATWPATSSAGCAVPAISC